MNGKASEKINIGILGCANIAERFVTPTIKELNRHFNLVGVASRSENKANRFAEKFTTKPFHSYDELLSVDSLNAVYIPLPNGLHYEWIKKSLSRGLHVIVEKSLTCDFNQTIELNDLARKKGLILVENFQFRFHSQLDAIKKLIDDGVIGELRNLRSTFCFPPFTDKENIRYNKDLGGGALLDSGAYTIKISQIFLGSDISVYASSLSVDTNRCVDIWGSAYIKQKKGPLSSQITFGFDNHYQCNVELLGSKGKITADRIFTAPPEFRPLIKIDTTNGSEEVDLAADNHFKNMFLHLYNLVSDKKGLLAEYEQNVNQARLIHELKEKSYD